MKQYEKPESEVITLAVEKDFVSGYPYGNHYENPCEKCTQRHTHYCDSCMHKDLLYYSKR